jgi:hypothetical protein
MPSTYYYLKNAIVEENTEELGLENTLYLSSRYGECGLAFTSEVSMRDWA